MTRVTTRSTFPIALPSTVPTARPTCFALRFVVAGTSEAFLALPVTVLTTFLTLVLEAPAAALVLRLMVWAAGPTFRWPAVDFFFDGVLVARVVFLVVVFFNVSPFLSDEDQLPTMGSRIPSLKRHTQQKILSSRDSTMTGLRRTERPCRVD